jgi:protein-S-isoprenylcysteine O-methyltransferase Ste14
MKRPIMEALRGFFSLFAVSLALLFLPAWTLNYWQAWTYLAVLMASIAAILVYLVNNDPALLARRAHNTEGQRSQKVIHSLINLTFVAAEVVPGLDHRFGWSAMPAYFVIAGDVLVALGMLIIFFVFRENTFTASTVQVAAGQKVISTGLYALVRHPMYVGGLIFVLGIPLALGSWWGLLTFIPLTLIILWRLLDEERFLVRNLSGYGEYRSKVKYRLIPFVW